MEPQQTQDQPPPQPGQPPQPQPQAQPQAQPPHPDLSKPPAAPGEVRPAPIWVDPAEFATTQAELRALRDFKRQQEQDAETKENERLGALALKGQSEEALRLTSERYETKLKDANKRAADVETRWLEEKRSTEVGAALAGRTFVGSDPQETARMVRRLLELEIEAVRDAKGDPVVRDKLTMRPASEYLKERLESPAFAVFFAATNRGGSGTDGARPAAATPKHTDPNLAWAAQFTAAKEAAQQAAR